MSQKRKQRIVLENFTFNVGKLVIEQETDETEGSIPDTALKAIGSVISTPQQLLGIDANSASLARVPEQSLDVGPLPTPPTGRQRRRRRSPTPAAVNGSPAGILNGNGASSESVRAQILELKQEGLFRTERDAKQVVSKLHQQGHTTATSQGVQMALLSLTREKEAAKKLYRRKDKKWLYRDTPYEHA